MAPTEEPTILTVDSVSNKLNLTRTSKWNTVTEALYQYANDNTSNWTAKEYDDDLTLAMMAMNLSKLSQTLEQTLSSQLRSASASLGGKLWMGARLDKTERDVLTSTHAEALRVKPTETESGQYDKKATTADLLQRLQLSGGFAKANLYEDLLELNRFDN